jgi:hypothetical protein
MARPPILPLIEWGARFATGLTWRPWIDTAEKPEQRTELLGSYGGFHPSPEALARLGRLRKPVHVLAIAEPWCGDVRRHIPVLQKLADASQAFQVRYLTRTQNLDVFARLLTNGGEAIPKIVFLSADFVETGNWGPMPAADRRIIAQGKAANDLAGARAIVRASYIADPHRRATESELVDHLEIAATERVGAGLATIASA